MTAPDVLGAGPSRFLAMVSHEIRTPLAGLLGLLSALEREMPGEKAQHALRLAHSSGEQLRLLLTDLIDLVRADASAFQVTMAPVDVCAIVEEAVAFWGAAASLQGVSLSIHRETELPSRVMADGQRVRQVIDNLINNALKFAPRGRVDVRMRVAKAALMVEVQDDGIGIDPDKVQGLFADFQQIQHVGAAFGGAGLGLSLCRELVVQMGGQIGTRPVASGACFWFQLPCDVVQVAEAAADRQLSEAEKTAVFTVPLKVLVVEDVSTCGLVTQLYLETIGCRADIVPSGLEALIKLAEASYDVVLMDVSMPGMDGLLATAAIRALPGVTRSIPIIGVSAYQDARALAAMRAAGMDDFVAKPITAQGLYHAITASRTARKEALWADALGTGAQA